MKYFITILLVINTHYSNAQPINDSIITEGGEFIITKLNDRGLLHYEQRSIPLAGMDTIFYNNYQLELPLIEIKWWMRVDENLTILYKNDQLISIDPGWRSDLTEGKITKWKRKRYKRKKRHIVESKPINLLDEGLVQRFKSNWELLFENNIYIESLNKRIGVNEVFHYSNGVVDILVINKGELNSFIKKNINSFKFVD